MLIFPAVQRLAALAWTDSSWDQFERVDEKPAEMEDIMQIWMSHTYAVTHTLAARPELALAGKQDVYFRKGDEKN